MALLQVTGVFLAGGSKVGFEGQPGDPWPGASKGGRRDGGSGSERMRAHQAGPQGGGKDSAST